MIPFLIPSIPDKPIATADAPGGHTPAVLLPGHRLLFLYIPVLSDIPSKVHDWNLARSFLGVLSDIWSDIRPDIFSGILLLISPEALAGNL